MVNWRDRASVGFTTEKTSVSAHRGLVVANHPLASAAGMEMLAAGGNAVDAAIAALFTVTVVEPAMVGIFGGGTALVRMADGREVVIDGMCSAPGAAHEDMYEPMGQCWPASAETRGRKNRVGPLAVAVPGNLRAWCHTQEAYGTLALSDVIAPAIKWAQRGFTVSPYLAGDIDTKLDDILHDPGIAALLAPGGEPLRAGDRLVQGDYAETLRTIARDGAGALYDGELGRTIAACLRAQGGILSESDLKSYRVVEREPLRIDYRGHSIIGVPPPCSGGVSVSEILNIAEGYDIAGFGYGSAEATHLLIEAMKIATADRDAHVGDPDFADVPLELLLSKDYAQTRRNGIAPDRAGPQPAVSGSTESANTTHVTVADGDGNIVTSTQTINSTFGACVVAPGTGAILNNYMYVFNALPGLASSIAPGKRVTGNIAASIVTRDGALRYALGLPGGFKIPSIVAQTIINLIDHGMSPQEAAEAPRIFAKGPLVEIETGMGPGLVDRLQAIGHPAETVTSIGGCIGLISFEENGAMTGASCWRGDGVPIGAGGGPAREGVVFWPDPGKKLAQSSRTGDS